MWKESLFLLFFSTIKFVFSYRTGEQGVTLELFNNQYFSGEPAHKVLVPRIGQLPPQQSLESEVHNVDFFLAARWTGMLQIPGPDNYTFSCASNVFLNIDDTTACPWEAGQNPRVMPLNLAWGQNRDGLVTAVARLRGVVMLTNETVHLIHWKCSKFCVESNMIRRAEQERRLANNDFLPIPSKLQNPVLTKERKTYLAANQIMGWTSWKLRNRQTLLLLPERLNIRFRLECILCGPTIQKSLLSPLQSYVSCDDSVKVLAHSSDGRFWMNTLKWNGAVLTFSALIEDTPDEIRGKAAVIATVKSSDKRIRVFVETFYETANQVRESERDIEKPTIDAVSTINHYTDLEMSTKDHICWISQKEDLKPRHVCFGHQPESQSMLRFTHSDVTSEESHNVFRIQLNGEEGNQATSATYWLSTSPSDSYSKILARMEVARSHAMIKVPDIWQATSAVLQSNLEHLVADSTLVSFVSPEFGNSIYEWDNYFVTYMFAARLKQLDLALPMYARVVATKALSGQTPNVSFIGTDPLVNPILCTEGKTEPPVGVLVLTKILQVCKREKRDCSWLPRLVANDLLRWNDWFWTRRRFAGRDLLVLGDDNDIGIPHQRIKDKQAAMYESGLDNSPLYDDAEFDPSSHRILQFDVGMSGLYVHETRLLGDIFEEYITPSWGKERTIKVIKRLRARAMRVSNDIQKHLWYNSTNAFENVVIKSNCSKECEDGPLERYAPTMFYPLLGKVATDEQADASIRAWLLDSNKFCLGTGDFAQPCRYGIPSISSNDKAFSDQHYWRGRVWGPQVFLVYESLMQYKHLDSAKEALTLLRLSSRKLFLLQWLEHGYVMENYSAIDGSGCGSEAKPFYHWGALLGMVADDPLDDVQI